MKCARKPREVKLKPVRVVPIGAAVGAAGARRAPKAMIRTKRRVEGLMERGSLHILRRGADCSAGEATRMDMGRER